MKESVSKRFEELKEKTQKSIHGLNDYKKSCFLFAGCYWRKNYIITPEFLKKVSEKKKILKEKIVIVARDLAEVGYFSGINGITLPGAKKPYLITREEYYPAVYKNYSDIIKSEEIAIKGMLELGLKPIIFQK